MAGQKLPFEVDPELEVDLYSYGEGKEQEDPTQALFPVGGA